MSRSLSLTDEDVVELPSCTIVEMGIRDYGYLSARTIILDGEKVRTMIFWE